MTVHLLDTSAWVEYLRDTGSPACSYVAAALQDVAQVATTPPVAMELLAGATSEQALASLERLVDGLVQLDLLPVLDFSAAAAVFRAARRQGVTVRGLLDCLIAVVAERSGAVLVHRDVDLARVAALLPGLQTVDLR